MTDIEYKLTLKHKECGREIEKFARENHSAVAMYCQGCDDREAIFRVVDREPVTSEQVPGVGVR